jgi:hypothetical protein
MYDRIYPVKAFIIVSDILFCVKLYANAVQQARRNPGDPHSRPEDLTQPTPTCISSNIYSTAQPLMVATSTTKLLASQDMNRLFRLCVHPGPLSSHISQPLVASFDKTATAPQTEQY